MKFTNIEPIPFAGLVKLEDVEDKQFCVYCRLNKPKVSFELVAVNNGGKRWKCATCRARKSLPRYGDRNND
jgi:hypothetical protein